MKAIIEVSLRDANKANDAIFDFRQIANRLNQTSSNTWETDDFSEDEEENLDELISEIEDLFQQVGVSEYDIDSVASGTNDMDE